MTIQIFSLIIYLAFIVFLKYSRNEKNIKTGKSVFWVMTISAFVLRVMISTLSHGYETDMNCFKSWAMQAASVAPWNFYDSIWCDYPPGYLYVLAPIGFLGNIGINSELFSALIKLPAVLCDVLTGCALYFLAKQENCDEEKSLAVSALYLFCPAVIMNSAVWGQIDSVYALLLIFSLYCLFKEKYYKSALLFGLCIVFKMQGIMFAPIYFFVFMRKFMDTKDTKLVGKLLISVLIGLATILLVALPFTAKKGLFYIFELFGKTMGQYPYASLNAFNLFSALGLNAADNTLSFMFLNIKTWGNIFIVISVIITGALYIKGQGRGKLFYTAALLISLIYTFSSDMHERYIFPAIILFFIAAVLDKNRKTFFIAICISVLQFINVERLYKLSLEGTYYFPADDKALIVGSIFTVAIIIYAIRNGFSLYLKKEKRERIFMKENKKITRFDIIIMAMVTILYAVLSFVNLGDINVPKTKAKNVDVIVSAEGSDIKTSDIMFYQGLGKGEISVYSSRDNQLWEIVTTEEIQNCYTWKKINAEIAAPYIRIIANGDDVFEFYEFCLLDEEGNLISAEYSGTIEAFDEKETVPEYANYKNGTYFDEIYHARTAWEHIENIEPYEITHPPLGKIIIGVGIKIFGMNPFGWRFMGNIFGIMMLPLMYLFAKRVFKNSVCATIAMLLMCFDFMHFAQTRIATIDSFSVFFIMLMYYLMYIYYDSNVKELSYKKSLYVLLACGIVFGLGIATKWICVYAGVGLAVLFAIATKKRAKAKEPWFKICIWCVLFFVIIPFIIYFMSYSPYFQANPDRSPLKIFTENQEYMLSYHGNLDATHPFQTPWYHWPLVVRPIWFFGAVPGIPEGMVSSIASFGNPLIWWAATAAAVALIFKKKKTPAQWFVVIGYLSQYLPWVFIGRIVFIYHYFASTPFIILALVFTFKYFMEKYKKGFILPIAFLAVSAGLFVMFYPVLSGMLVSEEYVRTFLLWFPSWVFC